MSIAERLAQVRQQIDQAARRVGRDPREIELVAVSKIHPATAIREAYQAGQRLFGENYVQEILSKQKLLEDLPGLRWHFIGHLQKNKARQLVGRVELIETVDSRKLLNELSKRAEAADCDAKVLFQVKIGAELSKSGCAPDELGDLLSAARDQPRVQPLGLMVIPPFELDAAETRPYFRSLRELRDSHGGPEALPALSMGMSHDFEVAIEEGSTLVRVGTAVFGARPSR